VDLEGADRVLVEGGDEDHRHVGPQELEDLETVELRHLHVEEEKVRLPLAGRPHRLEAVAALPHDLDTRRPREILAEDRSRRLFVVDDQDAQGPGCPGLRGAARRRSRRLLA